jgi:hypothetical protein
MLHRLDLLVLDRSLVPRVVSIKFNSMGSSELSSVKFNRLLNRFSMNGLVSEASSRFLSRCLADKRSL